MALKLGTGKMTGLINAALRLKPSVNVFTIPSESLSRQLFLHTCVVRFTRISFLLTEMKLKKRLDQLEK